MTSNPRSTAQPRLSPGDRLREYRIVRLVGMGGMGAVYEAEHEVVGARVAIKEILFHPDDVSPVEYQRLEEAFLKEARLLIRLDHSQLPPDGATIPRAHNLFREADHWYLVMEYVAGDTLADKLAQKGNQPLDVETVRGWLLQLLTTLDYLHRQEPPLIHRDIKPSNLKVNEAGRLVLLDFGIAKGGAGSSGMTQVYTQSVQFFSPHYSPPEQLMGKGTDPRTDLFAVAATAHYLLSGTPPPTAETRSYAIVNGDADPLPLLHTVNRGVPKTLSRVVQAALSLKIENRPASAAAMRAMILGEEAIPIVAAPVTVAPTEDRWGKPIEVVAVAPPVQLPSQVITQRRSLLPFLIGAVGIVLVLALGWWILPNDDSGTPSALVADAAQTNGNSVAPPSVTATGDAPENAVPTVTIATVVSDSAPAVAVATSTRLVITTPTIASTSTVVPSPTGIAVEATLAPLPTLAAATNSTLIPTSTRLTQPTATSIPATFASTEPPVRPAISLVSPADGISFTIGDTINFQWSGGGTPQGSEYFDVRIWRDGEPHYGKTSSFATSTTFPTSSLGAGRWCWSVALVDNGGAINITAEAPARCFNISGRSEPEPTVPPL